MPKATFCDHLILCLGAFVMTSPVVYLVWLLLSQVSLSDLGNLTRSVWHQGMSSAGIGAGAMMFNSLVLALGVAVGKCALSLPAAYALVFFRLRFREALYGVILVAMFFPIETRILPTFAITNDLGLLDTYGGLILPITASGLGVLVFRQFLRQLPYEVIEAARIDGAGPMRVFCDIILPLSQPMMLALFSILFVLGWNQYVWPIMITITHDHDTLVRGMAFAGVGSPSGMLLALLAMLPPAAIVVLFQRRLVTGLTAGIH